MSILRTRKTVLLAKIEVTDGVDASPAASTDAILVENVKITAKPNLVQTNEVSNTLDRFGSIVGGIPFAISFDVYLKGSGVAGTAPEFGPLLKACGFAEVITASAVPASAEACADGGSEITAILGSSASGTAQTYRGMPVALSSGVSGLAFISDYATGKVATLTDEMDDAVDSETDYQIPINVLYKPASENIPSLTFYVYIDGLLYKATGNRGNMKLTLTTGGTGKMSFDFRGMFVSKTDASLPTPTYDSVRPPVFRDGVMLVNRQLAAVNSLNIDLGNSLMQPENPAAAEGFDPAEITERVPTGSIDPKETLVGTRNIMAAMRAGTKQILHTRYGATTGNKIGITIPAALYTDESPGDRSGMAVVNVPFEATGTGNDGLFICFY